ncbi:MAG: hypothetical protein ABIK83_13055 [Candidatus Zixiibacteriota bacterium]
MPESVSFFLGSVEAQNFESEQESTITIKVDGWPFNSTTWIEPDSRITAKSAPNPVLLNSASLIWIQLVSLGSDTDETEMWAVGIIPQSKSGTFPCDRRRDSQEYDLDTIVTAVLDENCRWWLEKNESFNQDCNDTTGSGCGPGSLTEESHTGSYVGLVFLLGVSAWLMLMRRLKT